jgi:glycosyltransferase involved in cell wall biosynthesis
LRGFISEVRGLREVIREEGADLVMIGGLVNPHAAIAARLEKVPVVWQLIDTRAPHSATLVMMGIVRLLADALLVTGSAVAKMHPGAMSFGDRLVTFFPPVDLEQFQASEKTREAVRAELGFQPTDIVIGSVGNVNPQKGYDRFARAAVKLHDAEPNARFAVFGAEYEQHKEYADGVRELAASGGLTIGDDIVFRDPGSNVAYFASALDLFWMTSEPRSEGIPTVIEEAMALGIPVVAFDVGSVGEAVLDGITGFVVAPEDVDALVASTGRLLSDPALRATFSTASAERAHDSFGLESCTDSHIQVFEAALGHRRRL